MLQNQPYGFDFLQVSKYRIQVLLALGNQHKRYRNEVAFPAGFLGYFFSCHCRIVFYHHIANLVVKFRRHIAHYLDGIVAGKHYLRVCHDFRDTFLEARFEDTVNTQGGHHPKC